MKKRLLTLLVLGLALGVALFFWLRRSSQALDIAGRPAGCVDQAIAHVAKWKAQKKAKTEAELEKLYQAELAKCSGAERGIALLVGAANFDYTRLGRKFLSGHLAPDAYLARVRDRSRKLRKAREDESWVAAFTKGDADGDLIPNDRDRCPNTPDLTPTDDQGCPQTGPLPPAPSVDEVRRAKEALKIVISPACKDAPVPTVSEPLQIGVDRADENSFLIAVTKVVNQPLGCPVFYEISLHIKNSSFFTGTSKESDARLVFRASENIDTAQHRQVFRIRKSNFAAWADLVFVEIEPNDLAQKEVRVRATNGNGLSSGWSAPTNFNMTIGNKFFPAQ